MKPYGLITEVQRFSVHDGPGIRTTVFFKGCPLRCAWCHNPECISPQPEELFYPEKCIGCGKCREGCFAGARVPCGRQIGQAELMRLILADRPYYGQDGGVTFSGGEPLLQADFLLPVLRDCRAAGISVALETSLYLWREDILREADFLMADLKLWDSDRHRQYTGVGNEEILKKSPPRRRNRNAHAHPHPHRSRRERHQGGNLRNRRICPHTPSRRGV